MHCHQNPNPMEKILWKILWKILCKIPDLMDKDSQKVYFSTLKIIRVFLPKVTGENR